MKHHRQSAAASRDVHDLADAARRHAWKRRLATWTEAAASVLVVTCWLVVADAASTALASLP